MIRCLEWIVPLFRRSAGARKVADAAVKLALTELHGVLLREEVLEDEDHGEGGIAALVTNHHDEPVPIVLLANEQTVRWASPIPGANPERVSVEHISSLAALDDDLLAVVWYEGDDDDDDPCSAVFWFPNDRSLMNAIIATTGITPTN